MVILRRRKITILGIIMVLVAGVICLNLNQAATEDASGVSQACKNSPECMAAVAKEQEANRNASEASENASLYETKVQELNYQISAQELQIAETKADIDELNQKIAVEEEKLNVQQEALAELYVEMHFNSSTSTISILAGSKSISDLAEKEARDQVVKNQVAAAVESIEETRAALEEDKASVEAKLAEQEMAKAQLAEVRAEQQAMVEKYRDNQAAYELAAQTAKAEKEAAEKAEQEAHPELYRGSTFFGDNTYPWQNDCPDKQDYYGTRWNGYYIGGYVCECVSYVGWKAYEAFGYYLAWGNANTWDDRARNSSVVTAVNHTPAADTIGQTDEGGWGHVFWVESVNYDGSINVTEYNNWYASWLYSGYYGPGDFGSRTISAGSVSNYTYIHFE